MSDRGLLISFGVSIGIHLVLLIGQLVSWPWFSAAKLRTPLEIIYDYEVAQQELRQLQEQLTRAKRETMASPPSASNGLRTQIRIPDRPFLATTHDLADTMLNRSAFIDLTNLTEASGGDPVLLTYFSAIREQIQRAANRRAWLTGEDHEGLVYVTFVLTTTGAVQQTAILSDRSVSSRTLQETALRIIEVAAPFPPFPPSIGEPSKTIVVPLEFLLGS